MISGGALRAALAASGLLCLLAAPPAHATEGLGWQWSSQTVRRWMLRAQVDLPTPLTLRGPVEGQGDAESVKLSLVLTCRVQSELGRNAWLLGCDVDAANVSATAVPDSRGQLQAVLEAWTEALTTKAKLEITQARHGRLRSVELRGLPEDSARERQAASALHLVLLRALAPLDLELPKRGDDKGAGLWRQADGLAMQLPAVIGASGGARLEHTVGEVSDEGVVMGLVGSGVIGQGADAEGNVLSPFDLTLEGTYIFDTQEGALRESQFMAEAKPFEATPRTRGTPAAPYVQTAFLTRLDPDVAVPSLGESRELGWEPIPPPATVISVPDDEGEVPASPE